MHGAHIATIFLMDAVPQPVRRVVGVPSAGWSWPALYATLSVATYRMLDIVHDEKSPILQVPGSVTYGCVMVGMALLALLALQSAWRAARAAGAGRLARRRAARVGGALVSRTAHSGERP